MLIIVASIINLVQAMMTRSRCVVRRMGQLRQVLSVVVPTTDLRGVAIPYIGIYAASVLLIAVFMKWLGRYSMDARARGLGRRDRR